MMKYRADIDGLRGLAVLFVVLYHAGLPYITGGFIGVDIFFVISGFLITSIILKDQAQGRFSYTQFYERRIRRIIPALYFMIFVVGLAALFIQTPVDLIKSSYSVLAALFFSANIYFWRTTNYFSDASDYEPFLHTWSLGVEEQFYFVFPLILLFLARHPKRLKQAVIAFLVISFAVSVYATYYYTWAGYYLLPSRAWQMMAGALLAIATISPPKNAKLAGALGAVAIAALVVPAFLYTKETRFPGVAAVAPTLGACLLIVLGQNPASRLARIFSLAPLVAIGQISYSLYLWHWPVMAFLRNYLADVHLPLDYAIWSVAVSFVLGYASWRYIEAPFRNRQKIETRQIFRMAGGCSFALVLAFGMIIFNKGLEQRLDARVIAYSQLSGQHLLSDKCIHRTVEQIRTGDVCVLNASEGRPATVALWGDSHASAFKPGFELYLQQQGLSGVFVGGVGCPPLQGVLKTNFDDGQLCLDRNFAALDYLAANDSIQTVILHARWALAIEGVRYGSEVGPGYMLRDVLVESGEARTNSEIVKLALERTVSKLVAAGKSVVLVGPVPEATFDVPRKLANNLHWNKEVEVRPTLAAFYERQKNTMEILQRVAQISPLVEVVLPHEEFCVGEFCSVVSAGNSLYLDNNHLSLDGALLISKSLINDLAVHATHSE